MLFLLYGSRDRLNGVIRTDDNHGLDWSGQVYREFRVDATPVE